MSERKISVNARVDVRHLAALGVFFDATGKKPRNRSGLIHSCIGLLHAILSANKKVFPIDTVAQAMDTLAALGIYIPRGTQGHKDLVAALQIEDLELESLVDDEVEVTPDEIIKSIEDQLGNSD